jgi:GTP cyclohydrolase I-like protein
MNTTVALYPGVNGTLDANNGQNGVVHICDHKKTGSHDRRDLSTLAHVDSKELLRELLRRIGEDPDREGLRQSPARIIRSWNELFNGYDQRADDVLVTQFHGEQYDEMVLLRDVEFYSTRTSYVAVFWRGAHCLHSRPENRRFVETGAVIRCLCARTPGTGTPDPADCQRAGARAQAKRSRRDDGG